MKGALVVLSVLLIVTVVVGHWGEHHNNKHNSNPTTTTSVNHKNGEKSHYSHDMCKYINQKGEEFNLHLFDSLGQLQFYDQSNTKSTVYVQVCGSLSYSENWGCGANSSVCVVSNALKGTSFGSISNIQRADYNSPVISSTTTKQHAGVEFMFGNGELCNNGIARKAVVTYVCNMNVLDSAYSYPKVTGTIDECTVSITVESPLACPVANYCSSVLDHETCKQQSPICTWSHFGRCRAQGSGCFGSHLELHAGIISFVIVTSAGLCLICLCGFCICACRRRRSRKAAARRAALSKKSSKGKKRSGSAKSAVPKPEANFDHLPVYQLVPGSSVPINPYNMENIQGYYMMPHHDNL